MSKPNGGYIIIDFKGVEVENFNEDIPVTHDLAVELFDKVLYAFNNGKAIGIKGLKLSDTTKLTGFYPVYRILGTSATIYIGVNNYEVDIETTIQIDTSRNIVNFGTNS